MPEMEQVRAAVDRADETLSLLAAVPVADTVAARHAMDGVRLTVLARLLHDVRSAVGAPVPEEPAPVPEDPQ
jgi:hypothetical protein